MAAAVPVLRLVPLVALDQAEIGLVNQGSGLECLPRLLLGKFLSRQLSQLVVDQRQEFLRCLRIAGFDGGEDARHVIHNPSAYSFKWLPTIRDCGPRAAVQM